MGGGPVTPPILWATGPYPGTRVSSADEIKRVYEIKRNKDGVVQFTPAPICTNGHSSIDDTKTVNLGGIKKRNYIKGVISLKMAVGSGVGTAFLLTPWGNQTLANVTAPAGGTGTDAFTVGPITVSPPYNIALRQMGGTSLNTIRVKSMSINDLTTVYIN